MAKSAHNTGLVNPKSVDPFVASFKKRPRYIPEDLKNAVKMLRVFAVYCPDAGAVLHFSDKYSECEKLSKSLLVYSVVVRFDPVVS